MPGKRALQWVAVLLLIFTIGLPLYFLMGQETRGIGSFQQEIHLVTKIPIRHVSYCCYDADQEMRELAERTADPKPFDCRDARLISAHHYAANIRVITRSSLFNHDVIYPAQLFVFVEFADGAMVCKIVDLPRNCGKEPIKIQFP